MGLDRGRGHRRGRRGCLCLGSAPHPGSAEHRTVEAKTDVARSSIPVPGREPGCLLGAVVRGRRRAGRGRRRHAADPLASARGNRYPIGAPGGPDRVVRNLLTVDVMRGLLRKSIPRLGAKRCGRIRPPYVMPCSAALAGLTALLAVTGCFQLNVESCRLICTTSRDCPGDLQCLGATGQGLCASPGVTMCGDASVGVTDAGADRTDAGRTDAEAGMSGAPSMLCHSGSCLILPETVRSNLVLLLWPSNLPAVGSPVSVWADQSGQGNDAHALYPSALPQVIPDGVQLDTTQLGTGFVVVNSPSLDFGSGDFAVIVVAGLSSNATPLSLFRKSGGARTSQQISIDWVLSSTSSSLTGKPQGVVDDTTVLATTDVSQPSVEAYTLYRSTDSLELRLNEVVLGTADLPMPGLSTTNAEDLYLGVSGFVGSPVDSIQAVVAIRGSIGSTELTKLEVFLRTVFMKSTP